MPSLSEGYRELLVQTTAHVLPPQDCENLVNAVQPGSWTRIVPIRSTYRNAVEALIGAAEAENWLDALVRRLAEKFAARHEFRAVLAEINRTVTIHTSTAPHPGVSLEGRPSEDRGVLTEGAAQSNVAEPRIDVVRQQDAVALAWPEVPPSLRIWPIANHSQVRDAFGRLLSDGAPWRYLPLRGSSETGKSHITWQMLLNALQIPGLACGRFDFKGTTDVDAELRAFVRYLDVQLSAGRRLSEQLSNILDALKRRASPALLIFDTYEAAGEAEEWVEKHLLLSVMREKWLRIVIAGQRLPESASALSAALARAPLQLVPPSPEEWLAFGKSFKDNITLEFVRQAHQYCNGRPSVLAQLLGPAG
jgi:hypothetical protein